MVSLLLTATSALWYSQSCFFTIEQHYIVSTSPWLYKFKSLIIVLFQFANLECSTFCIKSNLRTERILPQWSTVNSLDGLTFSSRLLSKLGEFGYIIPKKEQFNSHSTILDICSRARPFRILWTNVCQSIHLISIIYYLYYSTINSVGFPYTHSVSHPRFPR